MLIIFGVVIVCVSPLSAQNVANAASVVPLPVDDGTSTNTPENLPGETPPIDSLSSNNILHCDDLIRVTVFHEDDLTTETRVTTAGSITFPLIGNVQVAGKTIGDAEEEIRARLDKDYLVNPHVTVAILQYSKLWVTVLGQVQKPGNVEMPSNGGLDLLGAIALAGGYGPDADVEHVNVRRLVNGRESVLTVNARDLARNPHAKPFLVLPNDAVTIPYAEKSVSVLGEVQRPGKIDLPTEGSMDVLGALALAGGYTPDADPAEVDVRRNVDGRDTILTVNATDLAQNSSVKQFLVQPGDSITVHYNRQWVTILGEVQRPGKIKIPPEGGLDLLGAIALASGFSPDADIAHISVRRTIDGKDRMLRVNAKELSRDTNVEAFLLQPGDSITVPRSMF